MPGLNQSPTDLDFVQNPYPFYARARALGPLVHWADYGMAATTTHAATNAILRDRRFGREVPPGTAPAIPDRLAPFYAIEAHSMLELEPPRHTRLRALVLRAFTSRRIAALGPDIDALCHQLVDSFPNSEFDLLAAYCTPIPVIIIARLLGVPETMAPELLAWSNAMVSMYQARRTPEMEQAAADAARDFSGFLRGYVDQRRATPADDLITHLIAAEEDGEKLSTDELISTCILLLNAGHEATVHTLGNGVKALCDNGPKPEWLADDGIDNTVEEILRHDPPLHMFTRHAYEDVTLFGHDFRRGDQVACLLASANHDPAVFADPQHFNPARSAKSQLGFGAGIHFCVGAPLARLELKIALQTLFRRCPGLCPCVPPAYASSYHFHGLEQLVVAG
ncbi:MAG: cytochrome P450 [Rhodobacter sp.]|nr:cytochrome P450 [Rhodobacter sp.]